MVVRKLDGSYDSSFPGMMGGTVASVDASHVSDDLSEPITSASIADSSIMDLVASSGVDSSSDVAVAVAAAIKLACTLATAFVGHYNAPRLFNELSQDNESFQIVS